MERKIDLKQNQRHKSVLTIKKHIGRVTRTLERKGKCVYSCCEIREGKEKEGRTEKHLNWHKTTVRSKVREE